MRNLIIVVECGLLSTLLLEAAMLAATACRSLPVRLASSNIGHPILTLSLIE
jgi:hypothetical protein